MPTTAVDADVRACPPDLPAETSFGGDRGSDGLVEGRRRQPGSRRASAGPWRGPPGARSGSLPSTCPVVVGPGPERNADPRTRLEPETSAAWASACRYWTDGSATPAAGTRSAASRAGTTAPGPTALHRACRRERTVRVARRDGPVHWRSERRDGAHDGNERDEPGASARGGTPWSATWKRAAHGTGSFIRSPPWRLLCSPRDADATRAGCDAPAVRKSRCGGVPRGDGRSGAIQWGLVRSGVVWCGSPVSSRVPGAPSAAAIASG